MCFLFIQRNNSYSFAEARSTKALHVFDKAIVIIKNINSSKAVDLKLCITIQCNWIWFKDFQNSVLSVIQLKV